MHHPQHRRTRQMRLEQRLTRVADLYCSGKSQWEIADALGISQATVSRDLTALRAEWESVRRDVFDLRLIEELAKIDHVERTT